MRAAQAERLRKQGGRQSDRTPVQWIDRLRRRRMAQHHFREGAAESVPRQDRRLFGGQNDVAEDDADAAAVEAVRYAGRGRLAGGGEGQGVDGGLIGRYW